jgi:hypothetical protein
MPIKPPASYIAGGFIFSIRPLFLLCRFNSSVFFLYYSVKTFFAPSQEKKRFFSKKSKKLQKTT